MIWHMARCLLLSTEVDMFLLFVTQGALKKNFVEDVYGGLDLISKCNALEKDIW